MRINTRILLTTLLATLVGSVALAQEVVTADATHKAPLRWDYSSSRISRDATHRTLVVDLVMKALVDIPSQEVVYVTPTLVAANGQESKPLCEPIAIAGRTRYKVLQRQHALHNIKEGDTLNSGKLFSYVKLDDEATVRTTLTLPYEPWMAGAYIKVQEQSFGCAECGATDITAPTGVEGRFFGPHAYAFTYYRPEAEGAKQYTDALECYIRFELDRDELKPLLYDNQARLDELNSFIARNRQVLGSQLQGVEVLGYACPFGTMEHNQDLTTRRATTFADYIRKTYPELAAVEDFSVQGKGEDWAGLAKLAAEQHPTHQAEVQAIALRNATDTAREEALVAIDGGITAKEVQQSLYPQLRRSVLLLHFGARAYSDSELSEVYRTKPEALDASELFRLAQLEKKEGKDPTPIYLTAHKQNPSLKEARLNYASSLLANSKDADTALAVLQPVKDEPYALFLQAIAYDIKGDWVKADELLQQSAHAGCSCAIKCLKATTKS